MKIEDHRLRGAGWTVRLHAKGWQASTACLAITRLPRRCAPRSTAGGIVEDRKGWLLRTARGHDGSVLSSDKPMSQPDPWRIRRAAAAGIAAPIGCHTFRATGITAYHASGGPLDHARDMAAHERPRTTKLHDRPAS